MSWIRALERELTSRGVPRGTRRRIVLELDDHLRCEPHGEARLGDPAELARAFADDLAAATSRRAALGSFALLVPIGAAFVACLLAATTFRGPDIAYAETFPLGLAAALGTVLAPQVSLAAGLLALLGWLRTRSLRELPAREAALLRRRALTALLAGAIALAALGLYAYELRAALPSWWWQTTLTTSCVLIVVVLAAAVGVRRVARIRSSVAGDAGDLFDDLRIPSHRHPWAVCAALAVAAALAVGLAGGAGDGIRNAAVELLAVTGGFALLGRPLGLRA